MKVRSLLVWVLSFAVLALAGCGGGGGGGSAVPTGGTAGNDISGVASKGPINGGTVKVFAIRNGAIDLSSPIGQGQTGANGNYTIDIGAYTGPVLVEVTGGSYTDEVSGASVTINAPLRAIVANATAGTNTVAVTPLTELAYQLTLGDDTLTIASINDANAEIASTYKLTDIISTVPMSGSGTEQQKMYAFALGSFSQFVNDNKTGGESLDAAVVRLLTQVGEEVQISGGFSINTVIQMNDAMTAFAAGGNNQTGAIITSLDTFSLKISTSGIANTIGAIDVSINFPAGVGVTADPATGETAAGAVTISGGARVGSNMVVGKFSPASGATPAQLRIGLINAAGFGLGEFARVRIDLLAGGTFPANASAFSVADFAAKDLNGSLLNGISAALQ